MRSGATVLVNDALSASVRRVELGVDDAAFSHTPGQALLIEVDAAGGRPKVRAPYSIASGPGERGPGVVEIVVARDAPESSAEVIRSLPIGARVAVEGPLGSLVRTGEALEAPALFVAAGTGLSPLRSMIAAELDARPNASTPLVLLFGARDEDDLLWRTELEVWQERFRRFSALLTLSRPSSTWRGLVGRVQTHLAHAVALAGQDAYAFVCGPPAMVDDVMAALRGRHLPEARVVREQYG